MTCTQAFSQKRHLNLQRRPVAHMEALGLSSIPPGTEIFLNGDRNPLFWHIASFMDKPAIFDIMAGVRQGGFKKKVPDTMMVGR